MDNDEPAAVRVTIDQIVAANMRYWRKAVGMTQEELGERIGWSAANVSAVERSADEGRERRRFDAQALAQITLALGVPLIALFLPPDDDGTGKAYQFAGDARSALRGLYGMRELVERIVMPDTDDDSPVMDTYRERLTAAADRYMDPAWAKEIGRMLGQAESAEERAARVARLRMREAELLRIADEIADMASTIETAGGAS